MFYNIFNTRINFMISLQIHTIIFSLTRVRLILHLNKRQKRKECKQRKTEMAAAAEHAEEHAAQIHNEENAQFFASFPV